VHHPGSVQRGQALEDLAGDGQGLVRREPAAAHHQQVGQRPTLHVLGHQARPAVLGEEEVVDGEHVAVLDLRHQRGRLLQAHGAVALLARAPATDVDHHRSPRAPILGELHPARRTLPERTQHPVALHRSGPHHSSSVHAATSKPAAAGARETPARVGRRRR
jgi:hypothetical protein